MPLTPIGFFVVSHKDFFWFKQIPDQGPEQRESNLIGLCPLIIIILITYIIIYYYEIINYGEPSQPKQEMELSSSFCLQNL